MARSNRNCITLGREIGISPPNTLKIARQLGAVHLHTVNDPVGGPLRAHILRIRSDPTRTESWNRLVHLATLPPSPQLSWDEANELFTLTRELKYVKPPKGTRSNSSDEGRRRQQIEAKAASAKRRADADAARERLRRAATKSRHCNACGSDFVSDSPLHGCKQSKQLAKRATALIENHEYKTRTAERASSNDLPTSEPRKAPEYRWREIPSGHPGSGHRRR